MLEKGFPMSCRQPVCKGTRFGFAILSCTSATVAFVGNHAHKSLQVSKQCKNLVLKFYPQFLYSLQMLTHCVSLF